MIKCCFKNLSPKRIKTIILCLFNQYANIALSGAQTTKKNISTLQFVQDKCFDRATDEIKLPFLQSRHQFTDMCEVYKIMNDYYKTEVNNFFAFSNRRMRCHSRKLMKQHSKTVARFNFIAVSVRDRWNTLTSDDGIAPTLAIFKM